jgi:hypothetical protein
VVTDRDGGVFGRHGHPECVRESLMAPVGALPVTSSGRSPAARPRRPSPKRSRKS